MMVESDRKKKKEDITTAQNISKNNKKLFPTQSTYSLRFYLFFKKNDASLFAYTPKCQFVMKLPSQKVTLFIQPFLHIEFLAIFISFCNELLRM